MSVTITRKHPGSVDAVALITELEAHLEPLYPAKRCHGYSVEKLIARGVASFVERVPPFGDYGEDPLSIFFEKRMT